MKFILVKHGSNIVGKNVYDGDDDANGELIGKARLADKDLTYEEVDETTFDTSIIIPIQTKDQTDWQSAKAKGTDSALGFIAKKLGLE